MSRGLKTCILQRKPIFTKRGCFGFNCVVGCFGLMVAMGAGSALPSAPLVMMMVPAFPEAGAPSRIRHNRSANNVFVDAVARDLEKVGTYVEAQLAAGRPI